MLTVDFSRIAIKQGHKVLDLGCGEGRHALGAMFAIKGAIIVGVDISFTDLNTAKNRQQNIPAQSACFFVQANGLCLPFQAASFDHIICSEVLEHIHEYPAMLTEIQRLLKPGGNFVASVPRFWPEKIMWWLEKAYHQVEGGHIRIFRYNQLKQTITNNGFSFKSRHWAHALHTPFWWLRCVFWQRGENFLPVRIYHRFLVWDLLQKPALTRWLDTLLNPLMGKSVVLYFCKNSDHRKD